MTQVHETQTYQTEVRNECTIQDGETLAQVEGVVRDKGGVNGEELEDDEVTYESDESAYQEYFNDDDEYCQDDSYFINEDEGNE